MRTQPLTLNSISIRSFYAGQIRACSFSNALYFFKSGFTNPGNHAYAFGKRNLKFQFLHDYEEKGKRCKLLLIITEKGSSHSRRRKLKPHSTARKAIRRSYLKKEISANTTFRISRHFHAAMEKANLNCITGQKEYCTKRSMPNHIARNAKSRDPLIACGLM